MTENTGIFVFISDGAPSLRSVLENDGNREEQYKGSEPRYRQKSLGFLHIETHNQHGRRVKDQIGHIGANHFVVA